MATEKIDALQLDISAELNTGKIDTLITKLGELGNALDKLKSKSISVNINETGTAAKKAATNVNSLTSSFLKSAVSITAVIAVFRKLTKTISDGINNSMTYIKTLNMFTVSLGDYADNASKYAETVHSALGIDPANWQNAQGIFQTLITGFGVSGDKAAYMSQNLTQLTYDIASFYNLTTEEAQKKVQAAISGRLEPIRKLGYDLSQARLVDIGQNPANYGKTTYAINQQTGAIEANTVAEDTNTKHKIVNFNQLTQQEKVQLRYIALMTQVTQVQGNMARTLTDPANQMRIFKEELNMTSRALGNVFIPALNMVLPYLTAFTQLAGDAFKSLASLFGFKIPDMKERMDVSKNQKPYDHIVKATGKAAKNAKKFKDYTLGIDELNVFRPDTGTGSGSGSGKKGQNSNLKGLITPGYDFLGKAIENAVKEAKKKIQQFFADLKKNPFLLKDLFVWGATPIGEAFWTKFFGKTPEQMAADANKHGVTLGTEVMAGIMDKLPSLPSDWVINIPFMDALFGKPEELATRAKDAGRTVGEQFSLEMTKKLLEFSKHNPIFSAFYKLFTGQDINDAIKNIEKQLNSKAPGERKEKQQGYVSYDKAKKLKEIQENGKVKTKPIQVMNTSAAEAQKQGERYANGYAKGLTSKKTEVNKAANDGLYKPAYSGGDNNGNGASQFRYVSAEQAKAYAKGLGSQNTATNTNGKGLYKEGYSGASNNGTGISQYKYVSADMAKAYANNLGSKTAKANAYTAGANIAVQGNKGAASKISSYKTTGENSTKGYISGMLKLVKQTGDAGAKVGEAALKALKKVLKTGSPSKEAARIGEYTVQGYANGITQNTGIVTRSVQNMAGEALDAMSNASRISNSIITGGAISVSTSANAGYGIGAANGMAMESLASNIYQAVVSGMSYAAANTESSDINVIIDGKEVFKAVQTESRKRGVAISNGTYSR